ncbi:hypothetical protein [Salinibacillus xinjiangensis]|uniref:Uncharacterized protein n=1 Tax=Salinibacillus xinjiangensis TaxID=1229268 RepID=A0A6G1X565_9BACI|nr:hypothetical protein [Salinibacillus xinjiangensis]MRG86143.1 hypothetical protein [Salinibacillus xinjiangensis]
MQNSNEIGLISRKLIATFVSSTVISIILAAQFLMESTHTYNLGNALMSGSFFYMMYVGIIILIYGNMVSIVIEFFHRRIPLPNWLFIFIHGVFGLVIWFLLKSWFIALFGFLTALFYGVVDRWVLRRLEKDKSIKMFFIIPILIYALSWASLQLLSPSLPPFTEEDAVEFATNSEGTIIDQFPDEIGASSTQIDGYQVVRQTSVEKIDDEEYIVTFTETWEKGSATGSRFWSYRIGRGVLTAHDSGGDEPPF